ncbi:hypothetical protein GGE45_003910 [Rhizobium aethiopicum]|nr:hypothetical protein [Rhizobium aethiopicum]
MRKRKCALRAVFESPAPAPAAAAKGSRPRWLTLGGAAE